jgi:hypothetical protein
MKTVIEIHPHGILFLPPVPLEVMGRTDKIASAILDKNARLLVMHTQIGRRLNGIAICTAKGGDRWTAELNELPIPRVTGLSWLDEWLDRGEVGVSSQTIAAHYWAGVPKPRRMAAPLDADDFRRCHLLVELAEANGRSLRSAIVSDPPPGFERVAPRWERLTELHLCGDYQAIYQILSEGR